MFSISMLAPVGVGIVRSLTGWFENAIEDGSISAFEWEQLGSTVVRTGLLSLGLIWGLNLDPVAASAGSFVLDFLVGKLSPGSVPVQSIIKIPAPSKAPKSSRPVQ